jgi:hypothetical protein
MQSAGLMPRCWWACPKHPDSIPHGHSSLKGYHSCLLPLAAIRSWGDEVPLLGSPPVHLRCQRASASCPWIWPCGTGRRRTILGCAQHGAAQRCLLQINAAVDNKIALQFWICAFSSRSEATPVGHALCLFGALQPKHTTSPQVVGGPRNDIRMRYDERRRRHLLSLAYVLRTAFQDAWTRRLPPASAGSGMITKSWVLILGAACTCF